MSGDTRPGAGPGADTPSRACETCRTSLGAYVLGALDPADASAVQTHLRDCPACRAERDGLAATVPFLAAVDPGDVERRPSPPGEMLLQRVLDRVGAERRRASRRRLTLAASVAALVALLAGGVWVAGGSGGEVERGGQGQTVARGTVLTRTDPQTNVRARLAVRPAEWGTRLSLSLTGVPENSRCRLVAVAADGRREVVASWHATYRGTASVDGSVAWAPARIARFEVVTFEGAHLVTLGGATDASG